MTSDWTPTGRFDRLSSTLFVAVLAHGIVILGITFAPNPIAESDNPAAINVTLLVDSATLDADAADAELMASRDQAGGGDDDSDRPTRTLTAEQSRNQQGKPLGADAVDAEPLDADTPADQLVSRNQSDRSVEAVPETTDEPAPQPMTAAALLDRESPVTLAAEVDDEVRNNSSDPDNALAPTTRQAAISEYMVTWRQRVERIGTANFPLETLERRRDRQRPLVEVSISADGALSHALLVRSSGNTRLDEAALGILELSAPFEPLPQAILAEHDELRFAYEWDFLIDRN